jgi:hypothetical protein
MSTVSDEKNSEAIMVRVTPTIMREVEEAQRLSGLKPATLARMGLLEVVARLRAEAPEVSPDVARAIAVANARGIDVAKVLTDALEAKVTADAAA